MRRYGLALLEVDDHLAVGFRRSEAVDARDRGDDQHVAPGKQRGGGRQAQPLDLLVGLGFFLDVEVLARDVRLRLVVVVVGDEILDRVLGEEIPELGVILGGKGLVVRDHEGRPLHPRHHVGDGEGLAGPGRAQKNLVLLALLQAVHERIDRLGLVAGGLIEGMQFEFHRDWILSKRGSFHRGISQDGRGARPCALTGPGRVRLIFLHRRRHVPQQHRAVRRAGGKHCTVG